MNVNVLILLFCFKIPCSDTQEAEHEIDNYLISMINLNSINWFAFRYSKYSYSSSFSCAAYSASSLV